jgi:probable HAF family extracellular repeat protein
MRWIRRALAAAVATAVVVGAGGPAAVPAVAGAAGTAVRPPEATVVELRPLAPGDTTAVTGLDAGGRAVGRSGGHAVRWGEAGTPVPLAPGLPEGGTSEAIAVAASGAVAGSEVVPSSTPGGSADVAAVLWRDGERVRLSGPAPVNDRPVDINGREQVLLRVGTGSGTSGTALWDGGVTTTAPLVDGGVPLAGADLNEWGVVVGTSRAGSPQSKAWAWRPGRPPVELVAPGLDHLRAVAVNDRGDVVGEGRNADGQTRMVRWRDGRATDLGTLGGPDAYHFVSDLYPPQVVNGRGDVVGASTTASGATHAFRWRDGAMVDLGDLGDGEATLPTAVNRRGDVVGVAAGPQGLQSAVAWRNGRIVDLQALVGGPGLVAGVRHLNDRGQAAGTVVSTARDVRSYLWTVR